MMAWVAPGIEHGDNYKCRECTFSFVVDRILENDSIVLATEPARGIALSAAEVH